MLRTILEDIYSCFASFRRRAVIRQRSAVHPLWWLLVLPGLAVAQTNQCTFYQAQRNPQWPLGPGPVETDLGAAEADAHTITLEAVPFEVPEGSTTFGFQFGCTAPPGVSCRLSYGATGPTGGTIPPPQIIADEGVNLLTGPCGQKYSTAAPSLPQGNTGSKDGVGDPINPGPGNVYKREEDVRIGGASPIGFQRFYNSVDATGSDMGPGWRHSYSRSISVKYQATQIVPYLGQSPTVSAQYGDPATACESGFADIQLSVSAWSGARATYSNNVCVISNGGITLGTLQIQSRYQDAPQSAVVEYDIVRDDGKTYRYTTQGGSINNPPGVCH
jgi:hypothetical protein